MTKRSKLLINIDKSPKYAISCLIALCKGPITFNRTDITNMTSIAVSVRKRKTITPSQLRLVRRKLRKYTDKLCKMDIRPYKGLKMKNKEAVKGQLILRLHTKTVIIVEFPCEDIPLKRLVAKELRGKWDKKVAKRWTVSATYDNIKELMSRKFTLTAEVQAVWDTYFPKRIKLTSPLPLRPYQHEGYEWLETHNGRGILGDEMGLGKTLQTLAWLHYRTDVRPVMVTMPQTAKLNWLKECLMWVPDISVQVIRGMKEHVIDADIVLINHDIIFDTVLKKVKKKRFIRYEKNLDNHTPSQIAEIIKKALKLKPGKEIHTWDVMKGEGIRVTLEVEEKQGIPKKYLSGAKFKAILVDEMQNFKNEKAQRTQALNKLAKKVTHLIGISGTPIKNRPIEFYNFLHLLDKTKWPSKWEFARNYCDLSNNGFGWDYSGASNLKGLFNKLQGSMIRRLKSKVLKDLPPKTRTVIPIEGSEAEMTKYRAKERELIEWVKAGKEDGAAFTMIEQLKQLSMKIKLKHCIEWFEEYLVEFPKLVIFSHHRSVVTAIDKHFGHRCVTVMGGDNINHRQASIESFQDNKKVEVFNGSIQACKEAITLTAAKDTVTTELVDEPGDHLQAEDRVHRIGQESDNVGAYYLMLSDSIELGLAMRLDHKTNILNQTLDGVKAKKKDTLMWLLKNYEKGTSTRLKRH